MRLHPFFAMPAFLAIGMVLGATSGWAGEAGLPARPTTPAYLSLPPSPPIPSGSLVATVAFPNLAFQGAIAVRPVPGTNRLWVLEREGRIWSFENDPAATTKTLVLDLNDDDVDPSDATPSAGHLTNGVRWWCQGWDDCGLMGLAFHPDFAIPGSSNRGYFYVSYQAKSIPPDVGSSTDGIHRPDSGFAARNTSNRVARFTLPVGLAVADPESEQILLDQPDPHLWHNGGDLFFGNDGFLYAVNGDGGSAFDPYQNSQRITKGLFGGVMRIDVDWTPSSTRSHAPPPRQAGQPTLFPGYGIPNDNPFVGLPGVLEEFYAIGLRSPHRMTHDPLTGMILVGDIGQNKREEITRVTKGSNHQWGYMEGFASKRVDGSIKEERIPPRYIVATDAPTDTRVVALGYTAPSGDPGLKPGMLTVGDHVRFGTQVATIQNLSSYPYTSLTCAEPLSEAVNAGTPLIRTTGLRVTRAITAADSTADNGDIASGLGTTTMPVSGAGLVTIGTSVSFGVTGAYGSYQVIAAIDNGVNTTAITVRPSLPVELPTDTWVDRLTVIGTEQAPLADFNHGGATAMNAIIGGYIYRGNAHPTLAGSYLFADNARGTVYAMTGLSTATPSIQRLLTLPNYPVFDASGYRGLSGFGIDQNGELLICRMQANSGDTATATGRIFKLTRSSTSVIGPPVPSDLAATGAFAPDLDGTLASLTPTASLIPYEVNSPLWSDAAHKKRWVALPDDTTVTFTTTGHWTFPEGTVFVKHFELTVNEQTNTRRRLETRLLVRSPGDGVYGVTYKWDAAGTQATLVAEAGVSETYTIIQADGVTTRQQTWNYPSRNDCLSCHNANAGYVLGVNTRQLNGDLTYPTTGITDNQVHTWAAIDLFDTPPPAEAIVTLPSLVHVADTTANLERRVRSWLDANCSQCHRPGGVHAHFDARYDTPLRQQGLIESRAMIPLGLSEARIIARGDVTRSVMHLRDNSVDAAIKMPPLAKTLADPQAMSVMSAWIASLPYPVQIGFTDTRHVYDGSPKPVSVTVEPTGLPAPVVTYQIIGSGIPPTATPPTALGSYTVVASVSGDLLYAGQATTTLTIIANSAPVIAEGGTVSVSCDEDNLPAAFALTLHATDVDAGQTLTWAIIAPPNHGTLSPLGSGGSQVLSYVPTDDFNGSDSLTVRVIDGYGGSADCVVTVNIAPRNDAPVLDVAPAVSLAGPVAIATTGTWNDLRDLAPGSLTYTRQWQRADDELGANLVDLVGETASNHTLTGADVGKFLRVQVTASDDGEGMPAVASSVAHSEFVPVVPAGGSGSGSSSSSSGGGCGLGGSISGLLIAALVLLRRQRLR